MSGGVFHKGPVHLLARLTPRRDALEIRDARDQTLLARWLWLDIRLPADQTDKMILRCDQDPLASVDLLEKAAIVWLHQCRAQALATQGLSADAITRHAQTQDSRTDTAPARSSRLSPRDRLFNRLHLHTPRRRQLAAAGLTLLFLLGGALNEQIRTSIVPGSAGVRACRRAVLPLLQVLAEPAAPRPDLHLLRSNRLTPLPVPSPGTVSLRDSEIAALPSGTALAVLLALRLEPTGDPALNLWQGTTLSRQARQRWQAALTRLQRASIDMQGLPPSCLLLDELAPDACSHGDPVRMWAELRADLHPLQPFAHAALSAAGWDDIQRLCR